MTTRGGMRTQGPLLLQQNYIEEAIIYAAHFFGIVLCTFSLSRFCFVLIT